MQPLPALLLCLLANMLCKTTFALSGAMMKLPGTPMKTAVLMRTAVSSFIEFQLTTKKPDKALSVLPGNFTSSGRAGSDPN